MPPVLNRVILIGRLTRDPELRYTPAGVAVASFKLAVDRPYLNQQKQRETDFIPIVVWRQQAETCAQHLNKGRLVAVEGRLQVRTFETQEGQRRWVTEVIADRVRFLDRPREIPPESELDGFAVTEVDYGDEEEVPF